MANKRIKIKSKEHKAFFLGLSRKCTSFRDKTKYNRKKFDIRKLQYE